MTDSERIPWHLRLASQCESDWDWWGAWFHLGWLTRLEPGNTRFQERRAYAARVLEKIRAKARSYPDQAKIIPPRHPHATPGMIDLSHYYDLSIKDSLTGQDGGDTFARLPAGMQRFAGVLFDVRGIVHLRGQSQSLSERDPTRNKNIRLGRLAHQLHFLHAAEVAGSPTIPRGHYVVHYTHGREPESIPVIYGDDLLSYQQDPIWPLAPSGRRTGDSECDSVLAWVGPNPIDRVQDRLLCLYRSTWTNPAPTQEIASIEYVPTGPSGLLLVALTAE